MNKAEYMFLMAPAHILAEFIVPNTASKVAKSTDITYSHIVKVCHLAIEEGLLEVLPTTNKRIITYKPTNKGLEVIKNILGVKQTCQEVQVLRKQ